MKPAARLREILARVSIRTRVLLMFVVVVVPFSTMNVLDGIKAWNETVRNAELDVLAAADAAAVGVSEFVSGLRASLESLARHEGTALLDPARCSAVLDQVGPALPALQHMGIATAEMGSACTTAPFQNDVDPELSIWLERVLTSGVFQVSEPLPGPITGEWTVLVGVPIPGQDGTPAGVFAGSLQLRRFQEIVEAVRPADDRLVTISTGRSVVVARSQDADTWVGRELPPLSVSADTVSVGRYLTKTTDVGGRERTWGRVDLRVPPWRVFVGVPADILYGPRLQALQGKLAQDVLILTLAVMLALLLARNVTRSLADLADGVRMAQLGGTVPLPAGAPPEVMLVARQLNRTLSDFEEAKRREREAHRRYQQVVENAVFGIYVSTLDGRFLQVNPALVAMTGYASAEELIAAGPGALYRRRGDRDELIRSTGSDGRIDDAVVNWRRKDGRPMTGRLNGKQVSLPDGETGFEVIVEDITRQKELEELTRHQQKMEAVGRLAGGVAHEFNNLLTVLGVNAEMLRSALSEDDPRQAEAREIQTALERAGALTRKLLAFSRREVTQPRPLDVNRVLSGLEGMMSRVLGDQIQLDLALEEGLEPVVMDAGHLEQIILNLTLNARDAMPTGGRITLSTRCRADFPPSEEGAKPGRPVWCVVIAVEDDGPGMDEAVRSHVFEPFFTTKPAGEGTGLGLSTVHSIVTENGGRVEVNTQPGRGTTFSVWLPTRSTRAARVPLSAHGGTETLLVALEDEALRFLVRETLEPMGYRILESTSGEDALDLFWSTNQTPDLLLSDDHLAPPSERSLLDLLRAERPTIRYVAVGTPPLSLPFDPALLASAVREALDASA